MLRLSDLYSKFYCDYVMFGHIAKITLNIPIVQVHPSSAGAPSIIHEQLR